MYSKCVCFREMTVPSLLAVLCTCRERRETRDVSCVKGEAMQRNMFVKGVMSGKGVMRKISNCV